MSRKKIKTHLEMSRGEDRIPSNNLIAVYLEAVEINTYQFLSKDSLVFFTDKAREGVLQLEVSEQTTVVPFMGEGKVAPKYLEKIAYLGKYPGWLSLKLNLLEIDDEVMDWLNPLKQGAEIVSRFHKAGEVLGSLLDYIRSKIKSDQELQAFLMLEDGVFHQQKVELCFGDKETPIAKITLRIEDLGKMAGSQKLSVRIAHPTLQFDYPEQAMHEMAMKNLQSFNFEAHSSNQKTSFSTALENFFEILDWQKNEVFTVKAVQAQDRAVFPLMVNFSINPAHFNREDLEKTMQLTTDIGQLTGANVEHAQTISKIAPTVLSFLSEVTTHHFSIFSFNGFVALGDNEDQRGVRNGKMALSWSPEREVWRERVVKKLAWGEKEFGYFRFDLEVKNIND